MRVLLGVDTQELHPLAVQMVVGLNFPNVEVDLVHVVEPILPDASFPDVDETHVLAELLRQHEREGREALLSAESKFEEAGIACRRFQDLGHVAQHLIEHADRENCDLIAVRTTAKGYYGTLFFGSVAKGLLIGAHQSLLVVKGDRPPKTPLKAVLAIDHSPYCDRCIELLAEMAPQGIGHITVLTANEVATGVAGLLVNELPSLKDLAPQWIQEKLIQRNEAIGERLSKLGASFDVQVVESHPNDAIRRAMQETDADLLILGAQGHGFFARMMMGSKSFHQVVNEPYSVLVLRPGNEMEKTAGGE